MRTEVPGTLAPGEIYTFDVIDDKTKTVVIDPLSHHALSCRAAFVATRTAKSPGNQGKKQTQSQAPVDEDDQLPTISLKCFFRDNHGSDSLNSAIKPSIGANYVKGKPTKRAPETVTNLGIKKRKALTNKQKIVRCGNKDIVENQVYYHTETKRAVRVTKLFADTAVCEIITRCTDAIDSFFEGDTLHAQDDWACERATKGEPFLKNLRDFTEEEFDTLRRGTNFILTHSNPGVKGKHTFVEFRMNVLDPAEGDPGQQNLQELVLFAGGGASAIGDSNAGFNIKWLVERDSTAAACLTISHPDALVFESDADSFLDKCEQQAKGYPIPGEVAHLKCSSPWRKANRNEMKAIHHQLLRGVKFFRPRTGVMEITSETFNQEHAGQLKKTMSEFLKMGYQSRLALHEGTAFGVPQFLGCLILTFARGDTPLPDMPPATHIDGSCKTVGETLNNLPTGCDEDGPGLVQLEPGKYAFNHAAPSVPFDASAVAFDKQDKPITIENDQLSVHPKQMRLLSLRELARLWTFPDSEQFFGTSNDVRSLIINSVPLTLAEAVATPIFDAHEKRIKDAEAKVVQDVVDISEEDDGGGDDEHGKISDCDVGDNDSTGDQAESEVDDNEHAMCAAKEGDDDSTGDEESDDNDSEHEEE